MLVLLGIVGMLVTLYMLGIMASTFWFLLQLALYIGLWGLIVVWIPMQPLLPGAALSAIFLQMSASAGLDPPTCGSLACSPHYLHDSLTQRSVDRRPRSAPPQASLVANSLTRGDGNQSSAASSSSMSMPFS